MNSYTTSGGITYSAICDQQCSPPLAFSYLIEVKQGFNDEMKKKFGTEDYQSQLETPTKPLELKDLSKNIHSNSVAKRVEEMREQYNSQKGATRLQQVNAELAAVSKILSEDFDLMMDRDKSLSRMCFTDML